jgi:hypothetical protein
METPKSLWDWVVRYCIGVVLVSYPPERESPPCYDTARLKFWVTDRIQIQRQIVWLPLFRSLGLRPGSCLPIQPQCLTVNVSDLLHHCQYSTK